MCSSFFQKNDDRSFCLTQNDMQLNDSMFFFFFMIKLILKLYFHLIKWRFDETHASLSSNLLLMKSLLINRKRSLSVFIRNSCRMHKEIRTTESMCSLRSRISILLLLLRGTSGSLSATLSRTNSLETIFGLVHNMEDAKTCLSVCIWKITSKNHRFLESTSTSRVRVVASKRLFTEDRVYRAGSIIITHLRRSARTNTCLGPSNLDPGKTTSDQRWGSSHVKARQPKPQYRESQRKNTPPKHQSGLIDYHAHQGFADCMWKGITVSSDCRTVCKTSRLSSRSAGVTDLDETKFSWRGVICELNGIYFLQKVYRRRLLISCVLNCSTFQIHCCPFPREISLRAVYIEDQTRILISVTSITLKKRDDTLHVPFGMLLSSKKCWLVNCQILWEVESGGLGDTLTSSSREAAPEYSRLCLAALWLSTVRLSKVVMDICFALLTSSARTTQLEDSIKMSSWRSLLDRCFLETICESPHLNIRNKTKTKRRWTHAAPLELYFVVRCSLTPASRDHVSSFPPHSWGIIPEHVNFLTGESLVSLCLVNDHCKETSSNREVDFVPWTLSPASCMLWTRRTHLDPFLMQRVRCILSDISCRIVETVIVFTFVEPELADELIVRRWQIRTKTFLMSKAVRPSWRLYRSCQLAAPSVIRAQSHGQS